MPTIDFIGYITNDLFSVSSNVPDDIYIMKLDFTIYNASTKQPISNFKDPFLFFNILTNNLYKVFRSNQCLRYISNNQTYTYGEYKYNYIQADGFWISTDSRRTDYLDVTTQILNGYTYLLKPDTYDSPLFKFFIPIASQVKLNTPMFNSTINNPSTTASISNITPIQFGFDVQLSVEVEQRTNYVQFYFYLNDKNNLTLYSITRLLFPDPNPNPNINTVTFSFSSLIYRTNNFPFTMGVILSSDSKFTIKDSANKQFRIFT